MQIVSLYQAQDLLDYNVKPLAYSILAGLLTISVNYGCRKESISSEIIQVLPQDTIQFSGRTWIVKSSGNVIGPGPNYWNPANVWVDGNGYLHLIIKRDSISGKWTCAEVNTLDAFGYGTYQFWIEGEIDRLDKNIVLGLFCYSGKDGFDEMDVEIAKWGSSLNPNLYYTVWPAFGSSGPKWTRSNSFTLNGTYTTHRFKRTTSLVKFQSLHGFYNDNTNEFFSAEYTNIAAISKITMPVHLNLWLFKGRTPTNEHAIEIIVHRFDFIPG